MRIIALAAIVPSILVGVLSALAKPAGTSAAAAGLLSAAIILVALGILRLKSRKLFVLMIVLASVQGIAFGAMVLGESPPFPLRLMKVAVVLSYVAPVIAALLVGVRIATSVQAGLLTYSVVGVLFAFESALEAFPQAKESFGPEWSGQVVEHPELGMIYAPHALLKTYYPDNPRGYFHREDPRESTWLLRVAGGNQAETVFPANAPDVVRVSIAKVVSDNDYDVQLRQPQLTVNRGRLYVITFRARADKARSIYVGFANNHEPWANLGLYRESALAPAWKEFAYEFKSPEDDENAQIIFDLGNADASVEFADVTLRDAADDGLVRPNIPDVRYFVSYSMNSLGCRGRDYSIPRPRGTVRIVLLGDSYTLGVGVHESDTFAVRLEKLLNDDARASASGRTYEVVNCGVSGFGTREERLYYHHTGVKYEPNVVLLVMVSNDDMSFIEEVKRGHLLRPEGKMESLFLTWHRVQQVRYRRPFPNFKGCVEEIHKLNSEVKAHGAQFAIIVFRNSTEYGNHVETPAWDYMTKTITEGVRESHIPILALGPILQQEHPNEDLNVHPIDWHPNDIAHRTAARAIRDFLGRENIVASTVVPTPAVE